ncbi:hypothetical protein [Clostridium uliginosum]|uniref:hypothetical protein n=1 Tax=Clostridium uliginosum TaxID=119641 RepID=UPI0015881D43|nr:hypothetical protein [Clostridium uliginosum]
MPRDILKSIIDNSNEYEIIKDNLERLKNVERFKERKMCQMFYDEIFDIILTQC